MYADVRMIITNINTINKIILRTKVWKKKKVYILRKVGASRQGLNKGISIFKDMLLVFEKPQRCEVLSMHIQLLRTFSSTQLICIHRGCMRKLLRTFTCTQTVLRTFSMYAFSNAYIIVVRKNFCVHSYVRKPFCVHFQCTHFVMRTLLLYAKTFAYVHMYANRFAYI
jgi:hypothetical protein